MCLVHKASRYRGIVESMGSEKRCGYFFRNDVDEEMGTSGLRCRRIRMGERRDDDPRFASGIYLAYIPYENGFQYLAFYLCTSRAPHVLAIGAYLLEE
ncbi:hypothetical protein Tco_1576822 [Tanacetum coccineum]